MKHTRRTFFATLCAPLLARWMPKPHLVLPKADPVFQNFQFGFRGYKNAMLEQWGPSQVHLIMKSRQIGMTTIAMSKYRDCHLINRQINELSEKTHAVIREAINRA